MTATDAATPTAALDATALDATATDVADGGDNAATATATATAPAPAPAPDAIAQWSADPYADALRSGRGPLFLRRSDGWLLPLEVERWCASADAADMSVLRRCEGAVLDVGCGPGRLVAALSSLGHRVLGIDVSPAAVSRTVSLGGTALCRSVFDPLPGEGRWGSVLLIDGNIGIGGAPQELLERCARLLAPRGLLLAETSPLDVDERAQVHIDDGRGAQHRTDTDSGRQFPWARLGTRALLRYALPAGWSTAGQWESGGRCFVALRRS
ncbi:class I SAM-dependent methyltransferase [Streptomyces sp. 891-h]|uniref:class I SAM-dependent methyltransferase n=1 Tax=Streptomyces sp. 891-h TaxID=2720714 RepID=UPI001FAA3917|nr:class I SAM-dependent methyltransferase [Streptomyces sp. 891-h]UNZ18533.1 methyltransferase domain-containing protein [Streptomyces sp. 891-h]